MDDVFSEAAFTAIKAWSTDGIGRFLTSERYQSLPEPMQQETPRIVHRFCELCYTHFLQKPGQWSTDRIKDLYLMIIPQTMPVPAACYPMITPVLLAFMAWAETATLLPDTQPLQTALRQYDDAMIQRAQVNQRHEASPSTALDTHPDQPETLDAALAKLRQSHPHDDLPEAAMTYLITHREQATPLLLQALQQAIHGETTWEDELGSYALYLLAQFKEQKAYPLMMDLLKSPIQSIDTCQKLLSDDIMDDLPNIMASTYNGQMESLIELIENTAYDAQCRALGLESLAALYATEKIERQTMIAYLQTLFEGKLEIDHPFLWTVLIFVALNIFAEELFDHIRHALEQCRVDGNMLSNENLETVIKAGEKQTKQHRLYAQYYLIDDAIEAMMPGWEIASPQPITTADIDTHNNMQSCANIATSNEKMHNNTCPCGSGNTSQCCLLRNQQDDPTIT